MTTTINTDSIGNKYIGYAGDVTDIATGTEINDNVINLIGSFPNNTTASDSNAFAWRTDGVAISGNTGSSIGDGFFGVKLVNFDFSYQLNSKNAAANDLYISGIIFNNDIRNINKGVAYSNGVDLGVFAWSLDGNNDLDGTLFVWAGEVKGNSNISSPQTRSGIFSEYRNGVLDQGSEGVKQGDLSTRRLHLDTEAGANHLIDCGTDTGRLYLVEDDGAGGDGGTVGYCENLYLSKKAGLTVGGFVTLDGITDGGSEQGIVVGQWGDSAHLIMRVYDGVN